MKRLELLFVGTTCTELLTDLGVSTHDHDGYIRDPGAVWNDVVVATEYYPGRIRDEYRARLFIGRSWPSVTMPSPEVS